MEEPIRNRTYFTLLDQHGKGHPAMEYVAATLDGQHVFQVMPLKRFVKLIGSGERLEPLGEGRYIDVRSGRTYSARVGDVATLPGQRDAPPEKDDRQA